MRTEDNSTNYLKTSNGNMTLKERANLDAWRKSWVSHLRSGEYKQVKDRLKNKKGYCCLGVLCDIAVKAGHGEWTQCNQYKILHRESSIFPILYHNSTISTWGGGSKGKPAKAGLNDEHDYTFEQISDVIESRTILLPNGAVL